MSAFNISDEERKEILEKHKNATKQFREKQASDKEGLKKIEKKEEPKKEEKSK
jgi:hypothetical protein